MVQKLSSNMQQPHEEYPLLKVDVGGGDRAQSLPPVAQPAISVVTPNTRRQAFFERWPEFLSACWLTLFIFLILFVAFLASCSLNLHTLKRKSLNVSPCYPPRPLTEVFFHQIVQPDRKLPIRQYTEYLSLVAYLYPYLRFNVIFLINDKFPSLARGPRYGRFYNRLQPLMGSRWIMDVNDLNEQEIKSLQKYRNINVTVVPLSEFMAETPLKYRWKNVPMTYLYFYIRVYSVWKYGGIALDLVKYNNQYVNRRHDERISATFKQYNDDISCNLEYEDDTDFASMIQRVYRELFNQTQIFMNKTAQHVDTDSEHKPDTPLIRTHRNKRGILPEKEQTDPIITEKVSTNNKELPVNNTEKNTVVTNTNVNDTLADGNKDKILIQSDVFPLVPENDTNAVDKNDSEHKTIIFYDIMTIYSGAVGPSYFADSNAPKGPEKLSDKSQILTLDMGGTFVATIPRHHPFLANILNICCQRMQPGVAIEHALYNQCSGIFRSKYCNFIDILYL